MSKLYSKINAVIAYWRSEGDTASARELWDDAIVHLRAYPNSALVR